MSPSERMKKEIQRLQELHRAYRRVFGDAEGFARQVLEDLEYRTYLNRNMVLPGEPVEGTQLAFREGRRSIGLHIKYMLNPDNFTDEALAGSEERRQT